MTGKRRYSLLVATALWMMVAVSSCIRDDRSDCPPDGSAFRIRFGNVVPDYERHVARLDVFIFDSDGILYEVLSRSDISSFTPAFYMETELPEGSYRFVSWTNLGTHYKTNPEPFVCGVTTLSEAYVLLDVTGGNVIDYDPALLLHGYAEAQVSIPSRSNREVVIPVRRNNYRINLSMEGLTDNHNYTVAVSDDNGSYYFDNDFAPSTVLQYTRGPIAAPGGEFTTSLTKLRMERGRTPTLSIYDEDAGASLFSQPLRLIDLILARELLGGSAVDFSTEHEFDIHIIYDRVTLSATITVNGWDVRFGDDEELD